MSGNLSHSMRENYDTHGVEKYYNLVSASYRNPHFPGVQKCLHAWLDRWWTREIGQRILDEPVSFWDLAAGSGEVTEAILTWYSLRRFKPPNPITVQPEPTASVPGARRQSPPLPVRKSLRRSDVVLPSSTPEPAILASDPYTAPAFSARTGRHCAALSFQDVAEGGMPPFPDCEDRTAQTAKETVVAENVATEPVTVDMVISSFALHLCTPSELFALLYELSTKAQWLVVIAPHKKPEIKPGWGWVRWNIAKWEEADDDHGTEGDVEIVLDRREPHVTRLSGCSDFRGGGVTYG